MHSDQMGKGEFYFCAEWLVYAYTVTYYDFAANYGFYQFVAVGGGRIISALSQAVYVREQYL